MRRSTGPYLYRIVSFDRAVQLLDSDEVYFAHPSSWEDPYETIVRHKESSGIFAQCWCKQGVSDAMWRIYSPHGLGVRIRTTRDRLRQALRAARQKQGIRFKLKDVAYRSQSELEYEVSAIADALAEKHSFEDAVAALFLKRDAFQHEAEVRAVVSIPAKEGSPMPAGFRLKVHTRWLIDSILVDPRAPKEYLDAYRFYLKEKLQFPGTVMKSGLYAQREPFDI